MWLGQVYVHISKRLGCRDVPTPHGVYLTQGALAVPISQRLAWHFAKHWTLCASG